MTIILVVMPLIILAMFLYTRKVVIRFDTLFRKGFKKNDDKFGVYCFTGKQGTGKTYSAVDFLSEEGKNKTVITNVKSLANNNNNYIYIEEFEKIYNYIIEKKEEEVKNNYIIFYDEIFSLIEKGKISKDMLNFISQMRKRGLILITTAQEWLEINITFRRYVRYQVQCKMINTPVSKTAISINQIGDAYEMQWDNMKNEYICPIIKTTIKKCGKKLADSYDTYETIEVIGRKSK